MHSANVKNQRFGCLPNIDCQGTTMIEFLVLISDNKKNGVRWSCVPIIYEFFNPEQIRILYRFEI